MAKRCKIPKNVLTNVLIHSKRRCCLCFFLDGDHRVKEGQIAHVDRDAGNNAEDNLVYLCPNHHDKYDSCGSQTRSITPEEVRHYRDQLHALMGRLDSSDESEAIEVPVADLQVTVRRPNAKIVRETGVNVSYREVGPKKKKRGIRL